MEHVEVGGLWIAYERAGDGPPLVLVHGFVGDGISTWSHQLEGLGFRAMAHASAEADLRDVLPTVEVPTLLLAGDQDVRAPLRVAEALHASLPTSRLVVLPGVGHVIPVEAPEAFNREVRSFVQDAGVAEP